MSTPPRAVLYTRVSTAHQKDEGTSLETQYAACKKKADDHGAAIVGVFEEQQSGGDYATREGLQNALKLIESGEADTLIIYDMSRYSRDAIHQQQILNRVLQAGGKLVFTTFDLGDLKNNDEGRLAFGMQGLFADYERRKIRTRTMLGRRASAEKGLQVTHSAPFGYEIATRDKIMAGKYKVEDHKKYFIIEAHAEIVREIFRRYAGNESSYGIARYLHMAGVPTPRGYGNWGATTIRAILANPTYKGTAHFGKYTTINDDTRLDKGYRSKTYYRTVPESERVVIQVPAIVTPRLWKICNDRIKENQARLGGRRERKYFLTSILRCPKCGEKMHGYNAHLTYARPLPNEPVYFCRSKGLVNNTRCKSPILRGSVVEDAVLDTIATQLGNLRLLSAALEKQEAATRPIKPRQSKIELHRKVRELEKREKATVEAQIRSLQNNVSSKVYETELQKITAERDALLSTLHEIERQSSTPKRLKTQAQRMIEFFSDYMMKLTDEKLPASEKNLLLSEMVTAITARRTRAGFDVEINWRVLPDS